MSNCIPLEQLGTSYRGLQTAVRKAAGEGKVFELGSELTAQYRQALGGSRAKVRRGEAGKH